MRISLSLSIGHRSRWGRCPVHFCIRSFPIYTNLGAMGIADHLTLFNNNNNNNNKNNNNNNNNNNKTTTIVLCACLKCILFNYLWFSSLDVINEPSKIELPLINFIDANSVYVVEAASEPRLGSSKFSSKIGNRRSIKVIITIV